MFAVVAAAVAALPRDLLLWPWLLALVLPGALLARLAAFVRPPLFAALAGALLQLAACWAAWATAGPIERPAALAGTILPPLAFVASRRHDADATLALFLALCVLLVGAILGSPSAWLQCTFAVAAALQLRCEARLAALRAAPPPPAPAAAGTWLPALGLGALAALLAAGTQLVLAALPSPARPAAAPQVPLPATDGGAHRIGLSDEFRFDGEGALLDARAERLLTVAGGDGAPVPADLYLRSGFFELPGLDRWRIDRIRGEHFATDRRPLQLRAPGPDARRLLLEFAPDARELMFVPPDLCSIEGIGDLAAEPRREWFRRQSADAACAVVCRRLPPPDVDAALAPGWVGGADDLTRLPDALDRAPFERLLAEWRPGGGPLAIARAIAAGLQARCRYERREPRGPFAEPLRNFLDGDRTGFCMHFASAAAILLRLRGVPCRVAVGVYGGDAGATPGSRVYGSAHAHAWVEIPIEGRGFAVLDPTPPAQRGAGGADTAADAPAPLPASRLADAAQWLRARAPTPWPWLCLLALLPLWPLLRAPLLARLGWARARRGRDGALHRTVRRSLLAILRELARNGRPRPHHATLEVFAAALRRPGVCRPDLLADLHAAFTAYQEVRFGGRPFDDLRESAMARGLAAARGLPAPSVSGRR
jgi:transglutaminase-like putative cysteine protease